MSGIRTPGGDDASPGRLTNPRIVRGRRGGSIAFAARGHAVGETFQIGVEPGGIAGLPRLRVEDLLLEEARAILRRAERDGAVDFEALGFARNAEFEVWERTVPGEALRRALGES